MKKDFELLKSGPSVIANGIPTKVESDYIVRLYDNYMDDIYDYLESKGIEVGASEDDGMPWDYDPRFDHFITDEWGTEYIALNLGLMSEDEIWWDYDYAYLDTSKFPSYMQYESDRIWCLNEIDVPHSIDDLTEEDCKQLRNEVCIGSMYLADYNNSFLLDRNELYEYCESYDRYIEEWELEDTPENFAYYLKNVA